MSLASVEFSTRETFPRDVLYVMVYDKIMPYASRGLSHVNLMAVELTTSELKLAGASPGSMKIMF